MNTAPLPCVHAQEKRNMVKVPGSLPCPWCRIDLLEARLRKAEALIADAHSSWEATGYNYWREQQLRLSTYKPFLDAKI